MERGTHANAPALFQPNIFRPFRGQISPSPPPPPTTTTKTTATREIHYLRGFAEANE